MSLDHFEARIQEQAGLQDQQSALRVGHILHARYLIPMWRFGDSRPTSHASVAPDLG